MMVEIDRPKNQIKRRKDYRRFLKEIEPDASIDLLLFLIGTVPDFYV